MSAVSGRAFVFGDRIDTDVLAPGAYMKLPVAQLATHCLEAIDPSFSRSVRPGDIVVAGSAFGIGSSREQAAEALKILGVGCVIARSFARIFYRNALNLGLPVLVCADWTDIAAGDALSVDTASGEVRKAGVLMGYSAEPVPHFLRAMVADGGLVPHLQRRFAHRLQST